MAKTNPNNKRKRTKARKGHQAMALAVAEPRLRGPRQPRKDATEQTPVSSPANALRPAQPSGMVLPQPSEMLLPWSPWIALFRQQALLARGFLDAQQQFVKLWSPTSHRAAQDGQRQ
jgi:hypothetical protein